MPDSTPQDTALYARRVLERLQSSARLVHLSYAATIEDSEQLPTTLIDTPVGKDSPADPGWYAETLINPDFLQSVPDAVPVVLADERIRGGASTINRQFSEPFSAFAFGRLGIRWISPFTPGIAANVRGSLVHDALFKLYDEKPTQSEICAWDETETRQRIAAAVDHSFKRHEQFADSSLKQLLGIEKQRTTALLAGVIEIDRHREAFSIADVEKSIKGRLGELTISVRGDRIDIVDGDVVILDYKTGATKKFLTSGEPTDMQLVVYSCMGGQTVAGLGLFNVDSKQIGIDGAGPGLGKPDEWKANLARWQQAVLEAAAGIANGDVRVNVVQSAKDARFLNLLSRHSELRRDF